MRSPSFTLKAAFFNRQVGQKTNNTKILLRMDELEDIQNYSVYLPKAGLNADCLLLIYLK